MLHKQPRGETHKEENKGSGWHPQLTWQPAPNVNHVKKAALELFVVPVPKQMPQEAEFCEYPEIHEK